MHNSQPPCVNPFWYNGSGSPGLFREPEVGLGPEILRCSQPRLFI